MESNENGSNFLNYVVIFTAGFAAGVAVGALYAPKPGRRLRADLRRAAGRQVDDLRDRVDDLADTARVLVERGKDRAEEMREQFRGTLEKVRQTARA